MNRYLAPLVLSLALTATQSFAREPQAPPSPATDAAPRAGATINGSEGNPIFIGHYGEVIKLESNYTAKAEMHGKTEVVYFHPKYHDRFGYRPFQPKMSDFRPENFAPMGLMELVIISKSAPGGLRSLAAIRAAKEKELKQQGIAYRISEKAYDHDWPRGTFNIYVEAPYRLSQTYSESAAEFYILTIGGRLQSGDYGLAEWRVQDLTYAKQLIDTSVSTHITMTPKRGVRKFLFNYPQTASGYFLISFKSYIADSHGPLDAKAHAIAGAFILILAIWPGRSSRARRTRLLGGSLLFFSLLSGLAGFLVVYLPARLDGASWNSAELAGIIPVPFLPWISWAAARRLGSIRTKRVLTATGILAALWTAAILWNADLKNIDSPDELALTNALMLLSVGLTFAIAFVLSFGPLPNDKASR